MEIVTELALHSKQQDINIKPPPNLAKCVIIVIRKQATPHSFCLITNQFSMGKFTAGGEVKELAKRLKYFLKTPGENQLQDENSRFHDAYSCAQPTSLLNNIPNGKCVAELRSKNETFGKCKQH
ncbi:hypothetical protein Y1Q_0020140 [Alligator mississippiensis]|uniref:Uncharacterized protein n=1 Tax=Alligator mississippiensis TaxID=8496 RepID=A0A151LZ76_ALLMI|nr:hypothetical protein Y1Q_0020140 [Alligator mississippiensis]